MYQGRGRVSNRLGVASMNVKKLWRGIEILTRYEEGEVSAEHDVIYVQGPPPLGLYLDDAQILGREGWTWNDLYLCWSHPL